MKELPYYKHDVSEWINGNITLEDFYTQGVFINICSYYWFNSGRLTLSEIKRRLPKVKPTAFDSLIKSGILKVENDFLSISFLDRQLSERLQMSDTNSRNGSLGGRPKKATGLFLESGTKAKKSNREEKRTEENREEERRIEKIGEGSVCVSIKSKYLHQNPVQVYDLKKYFEIKNQIEQITQAGWGANFQTFLEANPARVFDDEDHFYNSFKKFCLDNSGTGKKTFKPSFNIKDI